MSVTDSAQLRENIRQSFRKACFRRLEGNDAAAVEILQEELPPLVKAWQQTPDSQAGDIEALFADELARTENAYWVAASVEERVKKHFDGVLTASQAEAMQSIANAQLHLAINSIKERLQGIMGELITYQGAEALGGRVAQELSERVRAAVESALAHQKSAAAQAATREELALQLDSVRVQLQGALGERIDTQLRGVEGIAQSASQAMEVMVADVKTLLDERLNKLVSAETFEARLMSSVSMLHDAQGKALQETAAALQQILEKRIAESSAPIYQRVSSLITFADWERLQREAGERMTRELSAQVEETIQTLGEAMAKRQGEMEAMVADRTEATILRVQDLQAGMTDSLKNISERIATMLIESNEGHKQALKTMHKELATQQSQALGVLSVQQQNFLGGLSRDWELLNKNVEELRTRQGTLEADLRAIAVVVDGFRQEQVKTREAIASAMNLMLEQLKSMEEANRQLKATLPQAIQGFERQIDSRLRENAQLAQAELNALQRKLEVGMTEAFAKRMKSLRVVTD